MTHPITSKREWYEIQKEGIFNTTMNMSAEEFLRGEMEHWWGTDKVFCVRTMSGGGGKFECYEAFVLRARLLTLPTDQWKDFRISEKAPDEKIVVQGEYDGTIAVISFVKSPMRFALQQQSITISRCQLLDLIGYEKYNILNELIDVVNPTDWSGKNPVIEFSVYSSPVGIHKEDMIIWEVRNY